MEELLNKLIKKGRVPFGIYGNGDLEGERIYIEEQDEYTNEYRLKVYWINVDYVEFNGLCDEDKHFSDRFSLREIASKGSGLWQFVCENGMVEEGGYVNGWCYHNDYDEYDEGDGETYDKELRRFYDKNYEYRLIETALTDEDKLEQFLLDNIHIDE